MSKIQTKLWILYDERAIIEGTEEASVLVSCDSLSEAWQYLNDTFGSGAIFEYDINGKELINGLMVGWRSGNRKWKLTK